MIIRVTDISHAGEARRKAAACGEEVGLGERELGALAIVVTEVATNLVKHAGGGSLIIHRTRNDSVPGIRVLGLDTGQGIKDISSALADGHSTSGTAGNGLGAIKRLSDVFDIHSLPGMGTAVMAEIRVNRKLPIDVSPIEFGVISVPIKGEDVCGDGWAIRKTSDSVILMVVDGLGHGILAAEAAREAERVFAQSRSVSPSPIFADAHSALRKTRGAAMAITALNYERGLISFAGIGNISATIVAPTERRGMASHNGIVGHQMNEGREFAFPWRANDLLIMHSDGVNTRWDLNSYRGIWGKHPALIAGILLRDFARERDDATVLVARNRQPSI